MVVSNNIFNGEIRGSDVVIKCVQVRLELPHHTPLTLLDHDFLTEHGKVVARTDNADVRAGECEECVQGSEAFAFIVADKRVRFSEDDPFHLEGIGLLENCKKAGYVFLLLRNKDS